MYNWPCFHSALLLNALAIRVVVLVLISCVCLLLEGGLGSLFCLSMCMRKCAEVYASARVCACQIDKECALSLPPSLPPRSLLSEFGRGSPGAPVAVMACSWLLWYRLGILALMMCKMSKQCLWHLQMAPPWPVLPNCSLIHGNGEHFFKWLPDACIRHDTTQHNTTQHVLHTKTIAHLA